jgi:hypothetical protein
MGVIRILRALRVLRLFGRVSTLFTRAKYALVRPSALCAMVETGTIRRFTVSNAGDKPNSTILVR